MSGLQTLSAADFYGPAIGALCFVLIMSRVPEPMRRTLNAVLVAGTCGTYLNGGFGIWELIYPVLATPVVYLALRSYRLVGVAWLMHAAWDLPHHLWGNPIWPFHANLVLGLSDLRHAQRNLVLRRRTRAIRTWSSGHEGARKSHSAVTSSFQTTLMPIRECDRSWRLSPGEIIVDVHSTRYAPVHCEQSRGQDAPSFLLYPFP